MTAFAGVEALLARSRRRRSNISATEILVPPALGDRSLGKDDAAGHVVEYASMTCPHCAHFHETTYPELKKRYIDTGKVRFIFREFPLDPLAAGASCWRAAPTRTKFFPLIETLFQQQRTWAVEKPIPPLLAIAKQAGFSEQSFNACLSDQKMLEAHAGRAEARRRQVRGQFDADPVHQRPDAEGRRRRSTTSPR